MLLGGVQASPEKHGKQQPCMFALAWGYISVCLVFLLGRLVVWQQNAEDAVSKLKLGLPDVGEL